jgi:hypothetical protein
LRAWDSADRLATFAEVYGDVRVIDADQKDRRLSRLVSREKHLLVPLDDPASTDALVCPVSTPPRNALSLSRWFPEAHESATSLATPESTAAAGFRY